MDPQTLRIVLADDHELFRGGVINTLDGTDDLKVVGQASNVVDVLELVSQLSPDIVLLDVSMPGGGTVAAAQISADFPSVRIAMLTVSEHEDDVNAALDAGASAYILKGIGGDELVETIRKIGNGEQYITASLAARLLAKARQIDNPKSDPSDDLLATLKHRESQILKRVGEGLSNREIGVDLGLSEKTIKHYMTNVLQKLQVRNRVQAAIIARDKLGVRSTNARS